MRCSEASSHALSDQHRCHLVHCSTQCALDFTLSSSSDTQPSLSRAMTDEDDDDETIPAVVIDCGSWITRAGLSDSDSPRYVFPTLVGRNPDESRFPANAKHDPLVGDNAHAQRGVLHISHPVHKGVVQDFEDMERIWHHIYSNELRVDPAEHPVLLTEPPLNPKSNREKTTEIMFETFEVPSLYLAMNAVLALFTSGRTTGTVLHMDGVSHSVPVYEGCALTHAIQSSDISGEDITDYLMRLLKERGYELSSVEREIVQHIKVKHCYSSLDFHLDLETDVPNSEEYELPDGKKLVIDKERFKAPEAFFKPQMIGKQIRGIHHIIYDSIMQSDIEVRGDLLKNIVLSGEETLIRGIETRLCQEVEKLVAGYGGKVIAPPERRSSAWMGGALLSALESSRRMWIQKSDYEEIGSKIVHSKCF